jgi:P pilus assembly chaperone PapD
MRFPFRTVVSVFVVVSTMLLSTSLFAAMIVQKSIIHYQPGDSARQDVEIQNPDKEPLYIQVEVLEVINPGADNEEKRAVANPKDAGFLVTPSRLAIQPGSSKIVRLVNLKALGDKERVFRINLKPVAADIEAEQTGVKILVGYQLLVLISPMSPDAALLSERKGNKLILTNNSNANVLLSRGQQCAVSATETEEGKDCVDLPVKRLYPGNKLELDLKYTTPVEYLFSAGTSNQVVTY